jgi:hypothetical protein
MRVCRAFADAYVTEGARFTETQEGHYERLVNAYPIHPEVFDRLYEDWTTIDGFQRTRGVLKLMAKVLFRLWKDDNRDLMVLPDGAAGRQRQAGFGLVGAGGLTSGSNSWTAVQPFSGIRVAIRSSAAVTVAAAAIFCLDPTANAITVNLPANPVVGQIYFIKDCTGQVAAHAITITPAAGNIDEASNFVIAIPY